MALAGRGALALVMAVASVTAVQYNEASMAEVKQRMIDAQSLDRWTAP